MKLYRIAAIATFSLTLAGAVVAQDTTSTQQPAGKSTPAPRRIGYNPMTPVLKELNLSQEQNDKITQIRAEADKKTEAIKKEAGMMTSSTAGLSREDRAKVMEKVMAMNAEIRSQVEGVLTPEQLKEFKAKMAERESKMMMTTGSMRVRETTAPAGKP